MRLLLTAPKYLSEATAPVMTLNYLMGLRVFVYPRGKAGIALSLIYLLFLLGIYCKAINMTHKFYMEIKLLKLEYILYELMVYVNGFVVSIEMILSWLYTKRFNTCYRKIAQVAETLRQLGLKFNYREIYFLEIGAIIIWFLFVVTSTVGMSLTLRTVPTDMEAGHWLLVAQIYGINISFIVILEFSILVKCLQMKFKLINELLNEGATTSTTEETKLGLSEMGDYAKIMNAEQSKHIISIKVLSQMNRQLQSRLRSSMSRKHSFVKSRSQSRLPSQLQKQFQIELQGQSGHKAGDTNSIWRSIVMQRSKEKHKHKYVLQTIRQVHLELSRISKTLCASFSLQITSELAMSIIYITGILYNLYVHFIQQRNFNNKLMDKLLMTLTMGLINALKVIFINRVCKNATYEGNKTAEIIHGVCKCYKDVDMREEIQQFALQILQTPVRFGAFGVTLNYQILGMCLKTVTTYMVIVIQMSNSLEASKTFEEQPVTKMSLF